MYIGPPILLVSLQFDFDHNGFISVKIAAETEPLNIIVCLGVP